MKAHLLGVDNTHVHASEARVVQERRVEGSADRLVASERKRNVADSSRDLAPWAHSFDLTSGVDEVHRVVVVLLEACADCKNIGVKDDVLRVKVHLLHQDLVRPGAHRHLHQPVNLFLPILRLGHPVNCVSIVKQSVYISKHPKPIEFDFDNTHTGSGFACSQPTLLFTRS